MALLIAWGALATLLLHGPVLPAAGLSTFLLILITLAVDGWMVYPPSGSLVISVVVFVSLLWTWAVGKTAAHGSWVAAFGLLLGLVGWQQQRRGRRVLRMEQLLEDLQEEQAVKEQAITHATQAHEALKKKLARYTQLQHIAEELSNLTDLGAIAELAATRAFTLIGKSDACLLYLVNPERQELSLFWSRKREGLPSIRAKHGDQFDRHALRTHRPLLVNDVRRDFRFTMAASAERAISSVIGCPILVGQSPAGVLRLDSAAPSAYTQDDLRFLDILLDLVSTAMTNAQLFAQTQRLAMTDGLTGLMLRRPFLEQLARELARATRSREPVSVLMADVDHFKAYNDAFGHTAGDVILKDVAEVLRVVVPPDGTIGRYGGEEFIVLLPRTGKASGAALAEKIRQLVQAQVRGAGRPAAAREGRGQRRGDEAAEPGGITVSLGVAAFPEDAQADLELIRIADGRMYEAKRAGRNRVVA